MSDTNRVRFGVVREATFNTTPATPAFRLQRFTSNSLRGGPQTVVSEEIIDDRQISDLPFVGFEVSGQMGFELGYDTHDDLLAGVMENDWLLAPQRQNADGAQITAVAATTYTVSAAAGGNGSFVPNHLVKASGFTNSGNNKVFAAAAGTTGTSVAHTGGTVEAAPPATARLKVIGFEGASGDITATATGLASTTLDFTTLGLALGSWVKVGGDNAANQFVNVAANNGYARITAIAANALTLDNRPTGWNVDNGAGKTIRVYTGDFLKNGTTKISFTGERYFADKARYEYFKGIMPDTMTLTLDAKKIIVGQFGFIGAGYTPPSVTQFAGATTVAASTAPLLNTSSNVATIAEGGVAFLTNNYPMSLSIEVKNGLRALDGIASVTAIGIGTGSFEVTGSLNCYFDDETMLAKMAAGTDTSLHAIVRESGTTPEALVFDMPRVKFADGAPEVSGRNADVMTDMKYQALKHATLLFTLGITQLEAIGA